MRYNLLGIISYYYSVMKGKIIRFFTVDKNKKTKELLSRNDFDLLKVIFFAVRKVTTTNSPDVTIPTRLFMEKMQEGSISYKTVVECQWLINGVDYQLYPMSSIWLIAKINGDISHDTFMSRIDYYKTLDLKWQLGELKGAPKLIPEDEVLCEDAKTIRNGLKDIPGFYQEGMSGF